METRKEEKLTIKKITHTTFKDGFIFPIIEFVESDKVEAVISNYNLVTTVRKGSQVHVKFIERPGERPEVISVERRKYQSKIPLDIPCPACGSKLIYNLIREDLPGYKYCLNRFCFTRPKSHLHLLGKIVLGREYNSHVFEYFLKNFALRDGGNVSLDNFMDFKHLFYEIRSKNTASREEHWISKNREDVLIDHSRLYDIELKIDAYLKKEEKPRAHFWAVANLDLSPGKLTSLGVSQLYNIDPSQMFLSMTTTPLQEMNMDEVDGISRIIDMNLKFLVELHGIFGNVKWN